MKRPTRFIRLLCLLLLLLMILPPAYAADSAQVVFKATEPDASGYFTVDMTVYNVKFNVFSFALRYDPETVSPVSWQNGAETTDFDLMAKTDQTSWMAQLGNEIDSSRGIIEFTGYVTPGESVAVGANTVTGVANIGSQGLLVYSFRFKKLGSAAVSLEIAAKDAAKAYCDYLPDGGALANAGRKLTAEFSVELPAALGESTEISVTGVESDAISDDGKLIKPDETKTEETKKDETKEETDSDKADKTDKPEKKPENPGEAETIYITDKNKRAENTVILQIDNYAAAIDAALVHIYPGEKEAVPYIDENSRTMVPVRFVAESLDAKVDWEDDTKTVVITSGDTVIRLPIDSAVYTVNGEEKQMDTAALLPSHGRTMVPIRFVAEALGKAVQWDNANRLVIITEKDAPWNLDGAAEKELTSDVLLITSPLIRDIIS